MPLELREKLLAGDIRFREYDSILDIPAGPKWLREQPIAAIVFEHLMALEATCEKLYAFTIMPNHVHLLVSLRSEQRLATVMQKLKGATARACNLALARVGAFWQHESYDRVMRRGEIPPTLRYIIMNPVKAGLVDRWDAWPYTYWNPEIDLASLQIPP